MVIADGGSTDGTLERARRFPRVRCLRAPRGRAAQMNAGARAAEADSLLFLHAYSRLPPDAFSKIARALDRPGVAAGSFCLAFDRDDRWLRLYARVSRINRPLFTYGDQGLFVRRETFFRVGGFRELPLLEDLEIQDRLRRAGRFVKLPQPVTTSARRFARRGPVRQQLRNVGIVGLYRLGIPPERLKRFYEDEPAAPAGLRVVR